MLVIEIPLAENTPTLNAERPTPNVQRRTSNAELKRTEIRDQSNRPARAHAHASAPKWPKFSSLDVRQRFAHYS
jgi:hypothetical protein